MQETEKILKLELETALVSSEQLQGSDDNDQLKAELLDHQTQLAGWLRIDSKEHSLQNAYLSDCVTFLL